MEQEFVRLSRGTLVLPTVAAKDGRHSDTRLRLALSQKPLSSIISQPPIPGYEASIEKLPT